MNPDFDNIATECVAEIVRQSLSTNPAPPPLHKSIMKVLNNSLEGVDGNYVCTIPLTPEQEQQ